jgi:Holliday junction resolvase RusA-like endonuclease
MNIKLIIPFEVTAASRPRVTRYGTFYSKNYEAFRKVVGEWLDKQIPVKLIGAIKANFIFIMPLPKSFSKKKKDSLLGKPCLTKKDCDNMIKAIQDILQGRYFDDDSQIYLVTASKYWGEKGIIQAELEEEEKPKNI